MGEGRGFLFKGCTYFVSLISASKLHFLNFQPVNTFTVTVNWNAHASVRRNTQINEWLLSKSCFFSGPLSSTIEILPFSFYTVYSVIFLTLYRIGFLGIRGGGANSKETLI